MKKQMYNQEYEIYDYYLGNTDTVTINGSTHTVIADIK